METTRFSFKGVEWSKVGKGIVIAGIGAALTYVTQNTALLHVPTEFLPVVTAGLSVLVNIFHKWSEA